MNKIIPTLIGLLVWMCIFVSIWTNILWVDIVMTCLICFGIGVGVTNIKS